MLYAKFEEMQWFMQIIEGQTGTLNHLTYSELDTILTAGLTSAAYI
jgi:hypothetical protein